MCNSFNRFFDNFFGSLDEVCFPMKYSDNNKQCHRLKNQVLELSVLELIKTKTNCNCVKFMTLYNNV